MKSTLDVCSSIGAASNALTVVDLLRARASEQPHRRAYIFLSDGETEEASLTYSELDLRGRAIAAWLQSRVEPGDRALLLYPPGLDYVAAFLGCLYAGVVAVPAYPPSTGKLNQGMQRFVAIARDAAPAAALTTSEILRRVKAAGDQPVSVPWNATDELDAELAAEWVEPDINPSTIAFLQYTSGSTSTPKGVMVSHENILTNERMIQTACEHTQDSTFVGWLPLYHDMGLIGNVLQPLYIGSLCVLMSPLAFLQKPIRWLKAITQFKGATSGGPNFAYDLCVRKTRPEERAGLDLSSWTTAFNGAEPIRLDTLDRFAEEFAPFGFHREAFFPCYGLAEATLLVSGGVKGVLPNACAVEAGALKKNIVTDADPAAANARMAVGCGRGLAGQKIVIVNPESRALLGDNSVGEIWLASRSVARGYWNRPDESKEVFGAYPADSAEGPFLRTGDLGFLRDGELFVTGRLKDLIIIRGQNYYPHDIEATVQTCSPVLRQGCGAAFSIEIDGQERLALVQEVEKLPSEALIDLSEKIRRAIAESHQLPVYAIALIKPGSLLKTSSGKIRRLDCRAQFVEGKLAALAEWREPDSESDVDSISLLDIGDLTAPALEAWLVSHVSRKLGVGASSIDSNEPIARYGLDSLAALDVMHRFERALNVSVPMTSFFQSASIREFSEFVCELAKADSGASQSSIPPGPELTEFPLSQGQKALYFLQQLTPDAPVYNIAAVGIIRDQFDPLRLRAAFQRVIDRHPSLRTNFISSSGYLNQSVRESQQVSFQEVDAAAWTASELQERILFEANRRFDLEEDNLLRVTLYRKRDEAWLLIAVHHIVVDFWSLAILFDEIGAFYSTPARLFESPAYKFSDYVLRQEETLEGPAAVALSEFWMSELDGDLAPLDLPTDRPRPLLQSHAGDSRPFKFESDAASKLMELGSRFGATAFMCVAAAFQALLHRHSGREDFVIGALTSGRSTAAFANVVGYFVNPIVLRADLSGEPTFGSLLSRTRERAFRAIEHQDYPFSLLVERLQLSGDTAAPFIQAMMIYQKPSRPGQEGLARLAVGGRPAKMKMGELEVEFVPLNQGVTQFDLTLKIAEAGGEISGALEYNSDLFDASTIARMIERFRVLLNGMVSNPDAPLAALPMMSEEERHQIVRQWNDTKKDYPRDSSIQSEFSQQAAKAPDTIALRFRDEHLSFGELDRRANRLAHRLIELGVEPETVVGIRVRRRIEMVVGMLGILKSGGAYAPLDPAFPKERLDLMIKNSGLRVIVGERGYSVQIGGEAARVLDVDSAVGYPKDEDRAAAPNVNPTSSNLAYVLFTSGSTGEPKGVMVTHRNVINFFHAMDEKIGREPGHWLAVTSISFDISVLELLWALTRGFQVTIQPEQARAHALESTYAAETTRAIETTTETTKDIEFSLFYFASDDQTTGQASVSDKYRLLFEGARFADEHGFSAVWTPERHFHAFGGLYPNPSVTSAALAAITSRISIRAGSVVLPLHNPLRVAEEWSVVDNISNGRVGVSVASGWHADDFIFAPENYAGRKEVMLSRIDTIRKLWRGERVSFQGGAGNDIEVAIFPRPIQNELPLWLTAAGSEETFRLAGRIGANLLTHLLGQSLEDLAHRISIYRQAWEEAGHGPGRGHVTLMVHTFIGDDLDDVRETVREPFRGYLKSSYGLIKNLARSLGKSVDNGELTENDTEALLSHAFDRYFESAGLMGTPRTCLETVARMKQIGVDEAACLIDFGVAADSVLKSLDLLDSLKNRANENPQTILESRSESCMESSMDLEPETDSISIQIKKSGITHLQCTPSMAQLLANEPGSLEAIGRLRKLLLGGEALPTPLARQFGEAAGGVLNMYGPTETTIWSTTSFIQPSTAKVNIGRPIANTGTYILDQRLAPVPIGVRGELHIGGDGVARGYVNAPAMTAERFIPDGFAETMGARMYVTGDFCLHGPDGTIDFLGRGDQQVKLRGRRIELGEIEAALVRHPNIQQAAVLLREPREGDARLIAYVVVSPQSSLDRTAILEYLSRCIPEYMMPSDFVRLAAMPMTPNGKINRKALPIVEPIEGTEELRAEPPRNDLERVLADLWADVLGLEEVGVHSDFFRIGGHSISASQLAARLRGVFQIEFPLRMLFAAPTVAKFAKTIAEDPETGDKVLRISELVMSVSAYSDSEVEAMLANN